MKLKNEFITYKMEDEHITVSTGNSNFSGLIRSNKTAAFIVESLKSDTTPEKIATEMAQLWETDQQTVLEDVNKIINKLIEIGAIDE
ncbi:MAG: PqqD family protein [Clostridia bacterium]|nr:PqqD family protein [Clostridia bacterium]